MSQTPPVLVSKLTYATSSQRQRERERYTIGGSIYVNYDKKRREYFAHSTFSSSGIIKEEVEEDIDRALHQLAAKMKDLKMVSTVSFIAPSGVTFHPSAYHISKASA